MSITLCVVIPEHPANMGVGPAGDESAAPGLSSPGNTHLGILIGDDMFTFDDSIVAAVVLAGMCYHESSVGPSWLLPDWEENLPENDNPFAGLFPLHVDLPDFHHLDLFTGMPPAVQVNVVAHIEVETIEATGNGTNQLEGQTPPTTDLDFLAWQDYTSFSLDEDSPWSVESQA